MKKFVSAAKTNEQKDERLPITYEVLGKPVTFNFPGNGQMLYLMTSFGETSTIGNRAGAVFDLLFSTMSDEDVAFIRGKMLENEFEEEIATDIFEALMEDWFADPSQQSSDSQPTE